MKKCHLVEKLKEMRRTSKPDQRLTAMTHLFGIIFAEDIRRSGTAGFPAGTAGRSPARARRATPPDGAARASRRPPFTVSPL